MSYGQTVRRGGEYSRLAEPDWEDPVDTNYSKSAGGRWNAPGSFGVLYLNAGERMARIQVEHKLAGQPFTVEDLHPAEQHDLVTVELPEAERLDCVTVKGLAAVGLPETYPLDTSGAAVTLEVCHPVGQKAYDAGMTGVACRSAASGARPDDEELALFETHTDDVKMTGRRMFADWYLRGSAGD